MGKDVQQLPKKGIHTLDLRTKGLEDQAKALESLVGPQDSKSSPLSLAKLVSNLYIGSDTSPGSRTHKQVLSGSGTGKPRPSDFPEARVVAQP